MHAKIRSAQKWLHYCVYPAEPAVYRAWAVKDQQSVDYLLYQEFRDRRRHTKCYWKHRSVDQNHLMRPMLCQQLLAIQ